MRKWTSHLTPVPRFALPCLVLLLTASFKPGRHAYDGLKGTLYTKQGNPFTVEVLSPRKLAFSPNTNQKAKNLLNTLWVTPRGKEALVHLLKTKSHVTLEVSDHIGFRKDEDQIFHLIGGHANPEVGQDTTWIPEHDGGNVRKEITIRVFLGSFRYMKHPDMNLDHESLFLLLDSTESVVQGKDADTLLKYKKRWDPGTLRLYYYLIGVHEISHTMSEAYKQEKQLGRSEEFAYSKEDLAKKQRRRVRWSLRRSLRYPK
ncbi:MAG: hypothetical protein H6585_03150 [Flavobacteriales bacterium]|nr:hypothetical protein [Flavobacteriales bacterium]MCB9447325.1 hypothetical protein [Flavobacteriales bacterium]